MAKKIDFFYFDLGNVVLFFDHEIACRNVAALTGLTPTRVREAIFANGLEIRYETGLVTSEQFHAEFCRITDTRPDRHAFMRACSDIFTFNSEIPGVLNRLRDHGCRLGVLSNTCEGHWSFVQQQTYENIWSAFETYALSYELKSMKPAAEIYHAAARLAGVPIESIFFVDDRPENVAQALAQGMDAVLFQSTAQLRQEIERRIQDGRIQERRIQNA